MQSEIKTPCTCLRSDGLQQIGWINKIKIPNPQVTNHMGSNSGSCCLWGSSHPEMEEFAVIVLATMLLRAV